MVAIVKSAERRMSASHPVVCESRLTFTIPGNRIFVGLKIGRVCTWLVFVVWWTVYLLLLLLFVCQAFQGEKKPEPIAKGRFVSY